MEIGIDLIRREYETFWADGYVVVKGMFDKEEMEIVKHTALSSEFFTSRLETIKDQKAFGTIAVWNDTSGNDIFSKVTRSNRIMERLNYYFRDDIYVYHNKIALKTPGVKGFPEHQDYAYWYNMGNIYPDMATAFVALDQATKENGCLRLIKGSHKLGRIDHDSFDGVPKDRLNVIKSKFEEVYMEFDVGDVVLFHCNTIHGSDDNNSQTSRLSLLGCYNTKHNDSYFSECGHPFYSPQSWVQEKITSADSVNLPEFR